MAIDRDQIAHGVQVPGLYDGICYYVMKDGTLVNRFDKETWPTRWAKVEAILETIRSDGAK